MFGINAMYIRTRGTPTAIICAGLLVVGLSTRVTGDVADKKTEFTFSAPVEVPGKVLPAGAYVFKLLDSTADRNIVQIFDKDQQRLYATILGIPDYRMTTPDKPIVVFEERAANAPPAIKAWFYPGDNYGVQFVYTHDRAVDLAKRTHQNVLSMGNEMGAHILAPSKSASDSSVQAMEKTPVSAVDPSGQPAQMSTVVTPKSK